MTSASKVRSVTATAEWRVAQRGKVVFTNGVFDLIHVGHVALLEAARREGDALIVAINSDASARRLGKGPERPITAALDRARVLAALACVDCVVIFEEDTPMELIRRFKPDVLVKGADYKRSEIAGGDEVESWGGRVVLVPLVQGKSTTAVVERVRDRDA